MEGAPTPAGGQSLPGGYRTDFASLPGGLIALRQMIQDADPAGLEHISDKWRTIHDALVEAQQALRDHTLAAAEHWHGAASDAFAGRTEEIYQSLSNGATYAFNASNGVSMAADALRNAKVAMPDMPGTVDMALRFVTSEGSDSAFLNDLANGMSRQDAIQRDGGQLSLLEERHQQAIVVMQRLETQYESVASVIGQPPPPKFSVDGGVYPPPPTPSSPHGANGSSGVGESSAVPGPRTQAQARTTGFGGSRRTPAVSEGPKTPTSTTLDGAGPGSHAGTGGHTRPGDGHGPSSGPSDGGGTTLLVPGEAAGRRGKGGPSRRAAGPVEEHGPGREAGTPYEGERQPAGTSVHADPVDSQSAPETAGSPTARAGLPEADSGGVRRGGEPVSGENMPMRPGGGAGGLGRRGSRRSRPRRRYADASGDLFETDETKGHGQDGIGERFAPPPEPVEPEFPPQSDVSPSARAAVPAPEEGSPRPGSEPHAGGRITPAPGGGTGAHGRGGIRRRRFRRRYATGELFDTDETKSLAEKGIGERFDPPAKPVLEGVTTGSSGPGERTRTDSAELSSPVIGDEHGQPKRRVESRRLTSVEIGEENEPANPLVIE